MKKAPRRYGLRLVRESFVDYPSLTELPRQITSPRSVFEVMQPFADQELAETFWILLLDAQHKLIGNGPVAVTRGLLNSALVHPREVFRSAIMMNAAAIILCHNHPSGDPTPSADDRITTEQLVQAGKILDIPVQDHLIVCTARYMSFAEAGLL